MNEAADNILVKLNQKVGIANKVTKHLTKLNAQAINISMIDTDMLEIIVDEIYQACLNSSMDNAVDELNIDLMAHNSIINAVFDSMCGSCKGDVELNKMLEVMFINNTKHISDLKIALAKLMWDEQRIRLEDIFRVIYVEDFNAIYKRCFYAYDFNYEETTFPPHAVVGIINKYIVDLFILEVLFRTDMKFDFPFQTAHITQDNVKKHGLDLIDLLKQKGIDYECDA